MAVRRLVDWIQHEKSSWLVGMSACHRAGASGHACPGTPGGFVANFVQKVMTGQLPLSVRRLRGERVELCGRSEALFPSLNHHLFFPDHVHEFNTGQRPLGGAKRFEP